MDKQDEQALMLETRRRYYREYMRRYRADKSKAAALKRNQETYWKRKGLQQAEVHSRDISILEQELQSLRQRA